MTAEDMERNVRAEEAGEQAPCEAQEAAEAAQSGTGAGPAEEAAEAEAAEEADGAEDAKAEDGQESPDADPAQEKETGSAGAEEDSGDSPEDVVDGDFRTVEEKAKGSFFRKKKDKRDERIEELSDQVKRQMAEFDNFRKRTEREKSQMFDLGARSVIEKLLPTVDNFERGLASAGENSEDPFVQGMEKVYRQLLQELEAIGVTPIEAEGKEFDPNFHNAVMHCEDDSVGENIIVQELQKGYLYHDTVVRHSMVKVAN